MNFAILLAMLLTTVTTLPGGKKVVIRPYVAPKLEPEPPPEPSSVKVVEIRPSEPAAQAGADRRHSVLRGGRRQGDSGRRHVLAESLLAVARRGNHRRDPVAVRLDHAGKGQPLRRGRSRQEDRAARAADAGRDSRGA